MTDKTLTIRLAAGHDTAGLERLAAIDSAEPLAGEVLLAEVAGELWAALDLDADIAVADPFRPSGEIVELLRFQAAQRGAGQRRRSRLERVLPRAA